MDDNLAWCPVCDRQILPRFVPVAPLQPTAPVAKPPTHPATPIVLPPPVKTPRPGLRKNKTAAGRVKRVSPPKTNDQLRRIGTNLNIADKSDKSAKKKVHRQLLISSFTLLTHPLLCNSCPGTIPIHLIRPPQSQMRSRHPPKRPQGRNTPLPYYLRRTIPQHLLHRLPPPMP